MARTTPEKKVQAFIGNSPAIQKIRKLIQYICNSWFNIFISGESGVGKTLVAQILHFSSDQRGEPFVVVECAGLPAELLEAYLFGPGKENLRKTERGAFEFARGGTVLLQKIDEAPVSLQTRILRRLQQRDSTFDCWLMVTSEQDFEQFIRKGFFREDLYFRLNILRVEIPPLRERTEDIEPLYFHFAERFPDRTRQILHELFTKEVFDFMRQYYWPGNVRELKDIVTRLAFHEDWQPVKKMLSERGSRIHPSTIVRSIEFPPEYHQAGVSILNYFGTILRRKYPGKKARVRIEQDGLKVIMIIDPLEGEREVFEQALDEYGLVITGKIPFEKFTDDPLLAIELKQELRIANARIETQRDLLNYKDTAIEKLFNILGKGVLRAEHPQITMQFSPKMETHVSQNLQLPVEVSFIQAGFKQLKGSIPKGSTEAQNLLKIVNELEILGNVGSTEAVKNSSVMSDVRRFLQSLDKPESRMGKLIKGVRDGVSIAQRIADYYDGIAQWCGLPQVPKPFLGKNSGG